MSKVILILSDALRNDIAAEQMGYLEHLVEERQASRYIVVASLPTLSRPLYETLHTGVTPNEHGIVSNYTVRCSIMPNIFQIAHEHGRTTAAAAYCWYSELYIRAPYDPVRDREIDDKTSLIQHGRFYQDDYYPDIELFAAGGMLVQRFAPDYLLLHPMGLDTVGHLHGGDSSEYRNQAAKQDQIIAYCVPTWLQLGYTVLVTGDHGMNSHKQHNGTAPDVRHVPLYIIGSHRLGKGDTGETVSQLQIAPTICALLGVPHAPTMKHPAIVG